MQQSYGQVLGVSETVDVVEMVEECLRITMNALTRHHIEVIREFKAAPRIEVDRHRLIQILVNLVQNAKQACDESGREAKRITLRLDHGDGRVRIAVIDNGVGIAPENLTRIFAHGFTTKKNGHGFGLHGSACSVREMGAELTVQSEGLGHGASFTLALPLQPPNNQPARLPDGAARASLDSR